MKSSIFRSLAFFVVGIALTGTVLVNPMEWDWARAVQDRLGLPMRGMDPEPGLTPTGSEEREVLYWRAPMDPNFIRDEPGQSPMGMDLVPVLADEAGSIPGLVEIDPVFIQNMGVRSELVQRTDIPHTIRTVGTFTYDDSQIYSINTKYEGWIENVQVNYIGQPVEEGQVLFDIFSPQLLSTQQEYLGALRYADRLNADAYPEIAARARSLVESSRQRLSYWDVTDTQIAMLEASGEPFRTITLESPVSGLVLSKMNQALEGMLARPGMVLYEIVDLSTIWLEAEVYETDAPAVRVGQRVRIAAPHVPGGTATGTIRYIYPYLDPATRTLKLAIEISNPTGQFRADMYADVTLDVPSAQNVLAVPQEAVIRSGQRDVVVLELGGGTFQVREVVLGFNGSGLWEIREGIAEGDRVVVSSQFLIDSESNLREAIRKLVSDAPFPSPDMEGMDMDDSGTNETDMSADPQ